MILLEIILSYLISVKFVFVFNTQHITKLVPEWLVYRHDEDDILHYQSPTGLNLYGNKTKELGVEDLMEKGRKQVSFNKKCVSTPLFPELYFNLPGPFIHRLLMERWKFFQASNQQTAGGPTFSVCFVLFS